MLASKIIKWGIIIIFMGISSLSHAYEKEVEAIPYGQNSAKGHYAKVNGIKLYYEIYGSGEPLVLIHGNGDSIAGLSAQIAYFSKTYKVIVADSRGHGKSGLGTDQINYIQMMEDWNGLLEHLNVKNAKIFGWSDGGILGLLMAMNHPDKVGKLATMGANLRPDKTAVEGWVFPILDEARQQVNEMSAQQDKSQNWDLQIQLLTLLQTQPQIDPKSLHKIKIPVLVIAGDRDVIRGDHTLEIFQNLEKSQLAILPGHTHFAPAVDPVLFNSLLANFFDKPFTMPTTKAIMEGMMGQ